MSFSFELQQILIPNVPGRKLGRKIEYIDTCMFHRIHVGDPETDDGIAIASFFEREGKKWIGAAQMPYSFIVPRKQPPGSLVIVQQCVPLNRKTPHAKAWNRRAVGVGVVGDFRQQTPTKKQKMGCLWIASRLRDICENHLRPASYPRASPRDFLVTVHSAITTATSDPKKLTGGSEECPGPRFNATYRMIKQALRGDAVRLWGSRE